MANPFSNTLSSMNWILGSGSHATWTARARPGLRDEGPRTPLYLCSGLITWRATGSRVTQRSQPARARLGRLARDSDGSRAIRTAQPAQGLVAGTSKESPKFKLVRMCPKRGQSQTCVGLVEVISGLIMEDKMNIYCVKGSKIFPESRA